MNSRIIIFKIFRITCMCLLFIMPCYFYYFGTQLHIIPALDLCIIYYLIVYNNLRSLSMFIIGILVDTLYGIPIGSTPVALISGGVILKRMQGIVILKEYYMNMILFIPYCIYILSLRYIFSVVWDDKLIDTVDFVFYVLTTIAVYPIIKFILDLLPPYKGNQQDATKLKPSN